MNTRKGFTLVELLVVIAILAILATVSVVGYTSFITNANNSAASTELHQVETYIEADMLVDKVFQISATQRLYDNGTAVVYQELGKATADATVDTWNIKTDSVDITTALTAIVDLSDLKGTVTVKGNTLTYTRTQGGTATAVID